jgi:FkbM family methyltransferase
MTRFIRRAFPNFATHIRKTQSGARKTGGNQWSFEPLISLALDPDLLVDVGVAGGTPELYRFFPDCPLVMIGPFPEQIAPLTRPVTIIGKAAGARTGVVDLHFNARKPHQSSLYRRTLHDGTVRRAEMDTLDNMLANHPGQRLVVKIDVEGAELEVLEGATRTMQRTDCMFVEVNMGYLFERERNPLPDVDSLMKGAGFTLYRIMDATMVGSAADVQITKADFCYVSNGLLAERFTSARGHAASRRKAR